MKKYTENEWVLKVNEKHNGKYDYTKTHYKSSNEKITVTCHAKDENGVEHGDFEIRAGNHMAGTGCPKCGGRYSPTTEEWVEKAKLVHGGRYDYSETKYTRNNAKLKIICNVVENGKPHGPFYQAASSHLSGCGCPKCNNGSSYTKEEFIEKAEYIHNGYYIYDKVKYVNAHENVTITCPIHGIFSQTPDVHLRGHGCPKCKSSKLERMVISALTKNGIFYIFQSKILGMGLSTVDFYLPKYDVIIECQGEQHFKPVKFKPSWTDNEALEHYNKTIASDEAKHTKCEDAGKHMIYFTLKETLPDNWKSLNNAFYTGKNVISHTDELIGKIKSFPEVGGYAESTNSFIERFRSEVSGNITITERGIRYRNYMVSLTELKPNKRDELNCIRRMSKKEGLIPIIIFEDEMVKHPEIIMEKLKHILHVKNDSCRRIQARKCEIKEITMEDAKSFLERTHIQGFSGSTVYLGAFSEGIIAGVMCFTKTGRGTWLLSRYSTERNTICVGLAGKLLSYFRKNYEYGKIVSFADKRWTPDKSSNLYTKLGFVLENSLFPDYRYISSNSNEKDRIHKFNFRKQALHKKYGFPLSMTENEMTHKLGYSKIWDCGLFKYVIYK